MNVGDLHAVSKIIQVFVRNLHNEQRGLILLNYLQTCTSEAVHSTVPLVLLLQKEGSI